MVARKMVMESLRKRKGYMGKWEGLQGERGKDYMGKRERKELRRLHSSGVADLWGVGLNTWTVGEGSLYS